MDATGGPWSNVGRRGAEEIEAHCRQRKPGVAKKRDAWLSCLQWEKGSAYVSAAITSSSDMTLSFSRCSAVR